MIAAGYAPFALGTDIAGSVRLPAAYNGMFALKPSLGRVPIYPPVPRSRRRPDHPHRDGCSPALTAMTKPDPRDYMALPHQDIDWLASLDADVKGKKLGLAP